MKGKDQIKAKATEEDVQESAPDTDPGHGLENYHRTNIMSLVMHQLGGLEKGEMIELYHKMMGTLGHEADTIPDGAAAHNKASLNMHPSAAVGSIKESVKADLSTLFGEDTQLSEDFKEKASTLFEAAVGARVSLIEAELLDSHEQALEEELAEMTDDLLGKVDDYLGYLAEQWIEKNEVAIQSSLVSEITEDFMHGLKNLLAEHYIDIPEEKVDVVEMLSAKVEELEALVNESETEKMRLAEAVKKYEKADLIAQVSEGLTETQTVKLTQLAEGVDADSPEDFSKKVKLLREAHFKTGKQYYKASDTGLITEEIAHDSENDPEYVKPVRPEMRGYVTAVKRTLGRGTA